MPSRPKTEQLNDSQRALVADWWPTAKRAAYVLAKANWDAEVESDAAMALVELARSYDPDKGAFSTLFYKAFNGRLIDQLRKRSGNARAHNGEDVIYRKRNAARPFPASFQPDSGSLSSGAHQNGNRGNGTPDLIEVLVGAQEDDGFREVEAQELLSQAIAGLRPRDRKIVHLRMQGWSMQRIADELGVTESRICQIIGGLRPRLERMMLLTED